MQSTFFKIKNNFFGIYIFGLKSPKNGKISRIFTIKKKKKKLQNPPPPPQLRDAIGQIVGHFDISNR
jgi:hypothetical protein